MLSTRLLCSGDPKVFARVDAKVTNALLDLPCGVSQKQLGPNLPGVWAKMQCDSRSQFDKTGSWSWVPFPFRESATKVAQSDIGGFIGDRRCWQFGPPQIVPR